MPVTLAAPPGESEPIPTETARPATLEPSEMLQRVIAIQARDQQLVADRYLALFVAALTARLARAYRRDRDRLLRANLALQADLDASAVRGRFTAAQIDALAREVVELQAGRRDLTGRNQTLEDENARLRTRLEAETKPARGRWRR
jgi:cell division protein FtsB